MCSDQLSGSGSDDALHVGTGVACVRASAAANSVTSCPRLTSASTRWGAMRSVLHTVWAERLRRVGATWAISLHPARAGAARTGADRSIGCRAALRSVAAASWPFGTASGRAGLRASGGRIRRPGSGRYRIDLPAAMAPDAVNRCANFASREQSGVHVGGGAVTQRLDQRVKSPAVTPWPADPC